MLKFLPILVAAISIDVYVFGVKDKKKFPNLYLLFV